MNNPQKYMLDEHIFTIGQISFLLKKTVETAFSDVRVRGEISGAKQHSSGHWYLTLKDQDASIDAVCWKGTKLSHPISDGFEVIANGRITTYPLRSKYQMVIASLQPAGEGALLKLLMDRKDRLKEEGLFNQKRPLPFFPKRIGIITSPTGAVLQDILHRIVERYPCCTITIWPVLVQGDSASDQITQAIDGFNQRTDKPDVLIIARGGGSLEDLWPFNEENVVRATASSQIPTISAIGHETDTTLIDFASDVRAPTPTAAAEMVTPSIKSILASIETLWNRLVFSVRKNLQGQSLHLRRYALSDPLRVLDPLWLRLDDWTDRLYSLFFLKAFQTRVKQIYLQKPTLDVLKARLSSLAHSLRIWPQLFFKEQSKNLDILAIGVSSLSPQKSLERGFCIVHSQNQIIDSIQTIQKMTPATLMLTFYDGKIGVKPVT